MVERKRIFPTRRTQMFFAPKAYINGKVVRYSCMSSSPMEEHRYVLLGKTTETYRNGKREKHSLTMYLYNVVKKQ